MKREQLVLRSTVESKKGAVLKVISFDLSASGVKALSSASSREMPTANPAPSQSSATNSLQEPAPLAGR